MRVPAESWTSGIPFLIYINPRGPHGCATFERAARTYQLPRIHIGTHVHAAPHRTAPKLSCEVAAASRAFLPRWAAWPLPWLNPHLGRGGAQCGPAAGRGESGPCGQGSAGAWARVCVRPAAPAGLRAATGRARPGPAQRAEGARQRSGGFAGFLMGRICSGLRFKKKFDLWNRRLGEFKLDATD